MSRSRNFVPLSLALAAALPCATAAAAMPPGQTQPSQPATQPTTQPGAPTTPTAPDAEITDAEILMVIQHISETAVDKGKMAQKSAQDRRVKKFADMRVKRNNAAKKRQTALGNRLKLKSTGGKTADSLKQGSQDIYKDLEGMARGSEFDKTYIGDEIESLTNIVDVIDNRLLPYVDLPELRTELNTVRLQLESDLKEAQKLREQLMEKPKT